MKIFEVGKLNIKPVDVFERLFKDRPYPFLLESGIRHPVHGRYSIMGSGPFLRFKSKGRHIEINENGKTRHLEGNPFNILKGLLAKFCRASPATTPMDIGAIDRTPMESEPRWSDDSVGLRTIASETSGLRTVTSKAKALPYIGGAVGYFAYDLGAHIEKLPNIAKDDINLPDCYICFYHNCLIFDHIQNRAFIVGQDTDELISSLKNIENKPKKEIISHISSKQSGKSGGLTSNFTYSSYIKAINRAKHYISWGDIYQVNLSQRFVTQIETPPFELYKRLRRVNPAPFSAFLDYRDFAVVSSSPERFLKVQDGIVQTRPIKGTRPRGKTVAEDRKLGRELLKSEKDRAELVMIVDLERNDLGRVCKYGTVRVKELVALEKYPTVFHTVATVEGNLYKGKDAIDLLRATFPGGSITGAPKIRAMEIIEELEPTKRNIYTGAIGYLSFNGNMDLNIVIRTFIIKGNRAYFQVGGGIVADSNPEDEYQETLDKARALITALKGGQGEPERVFEECN